MARFDAMAVLRRGPAAACEGDGPAPLPRPRLAAGHQRRPCVHGGCPACLISASLSLRRQAAPSPTVPCCGNGPQKNDFSI